MTCEAGWNGTKCDQICSAGFYGEGCEQNCPPCKDGHTCNHINGRCSHCNPGWIGDRYVQGVGGLHSHVAFRIGTRPELREMG